MCVYLFFPIYLFGVSICFHRFDKNGCVLCATCFSNIPHHWGDWWQQSHSLIVGFTVEMRCVKVSDQPKKKKNPFVEGHRTNIKQNSACVPVVPLKLIEHTSHHCFFSN